MVKASIPDTEETPAKRPWRQRPLIWVFTGLVAIPGLIATTYATGWIEAGIEWAGWSPEDVLGLNADAPGEPANAEIEGSYSGGWGKPRTTYTIKAPSSVPMFNSITDNPAHGDERNFVQCKFKGAISATYTDSLIIEESTTLTVYVYVANSSTRPESYIEGARFRLLRATEPAYITGVGAALWGDNAEIVWDGCRLYGDEPLKVMYVRGSASLYIRGNQYPVADEVILEKALLPDIGHGVGVVPANDTDYGYFLLDVEVVPG